MTNYTIDNTDRGDTKRAITWQYDQAENLVSLISSMSDFFKSAVTDFWDKFIVDTNLANANEVNDFGLAVWGKILNIPRTVYVENNEVKSISSDLYRRLLVARFKLANGNASLGAYAEFIYDVFGGKVKFVDNGTMSLTLATNSGITLTAEETALFNDSDSWMMYPAGVRSDEKSTSLVFGLEGQSPANKEDPNIGGLDVSSFNWN